MLEIPGASATPKRGGEFLKAKPDYKSSHRANDLASNTDQPKRLDIHFLLLQYIS